MQRQYLDGKTLANRWAIAKFSNVFPLKHFILYSTLFKGRIFLGHYICTAVSLKMYEKFGRSK